MPGSLARPPNNEHRDREDRGKLTGELAEELEGDQGGNTVSAAMVVAAQCHRLVDHDGEDVAPCHGQAQCHTWETPGLQECHPTREAVETQQQVPRRRAGATARPGQSRSSRRGRDRLGRRAEAMATHGGETARSPRSEERA
jgi:hypothetical protein